MAANLLIVAIPNESIPKQRTLLDYDQCSLPSGWYTKSLKQSKEEWQENQRLVRQRGRFGGLPSGQLRVAVPRPVWEKIWKAVPVFGLKNIHCSAPQNAWISRKVTDPLILGNYQGQWYFIAAWGLTD